MTRPSLRLSAVILCGIMLCAFDVHAQDDAARQRMLELNDEGFAAFEEGRFAEAAQKFSEAYELVPDPNLRKNESIAWFKAGECDRAVPAANAFLLADNTTASDKVEARSVLANCKVRMARKAMDAGSYDLAGQLLDEAESLEPDGFARDEISMARVELAERRASSGEGSGASVLGWTLTSAGSAILIGTLVYHLLALSWNAELRQLSETGSADEPGDRERFEQLQSRLRVARSVYVPLYAVGAVTTGGGVYFLVRSSSDAAGQARRTGIEGGFVVRF